MASLAARATIERGLRTRELLRDLGLVSRPCSDRRADRSAATASRSVPCRAPALLARARSLSRASRRRLGGMRRCRCRPRSVAACDGDRRGLRLAVRAARVRRVRRRFGFASPFIEQHGTGGREPEIDQEHEQRSEPDAALRRCGDRRLDPSTVAGAPAKRCSAAVSCWARCGGPARRQLVLRRDAAAMSAGCSARCGGVRRRARFGGMRRRRVRCRCHRGLRGGGAAPGRGRG